MKVRWKLKQSVFLLISGLFLTLVCFSLSSAGIDFSPDIPITLGGTSFDERDVISYDDPDYSILVDGEVLGLPKGVEISAYTPYLEDYIVFAIDVPVTINGVDFDCQDLIMSDGIDVSHGGSVSMFGTPPGACIDALYANAEYLYFSLDVPGSLIDVDDLQPHDVYASTLVLTDMHKAFDGSDHGISEATDLDGVDLFEDGHIKISFDVPTEFASLEVTERDICDYDENLSSWSIYFDGDSAGLPQGMNVDTIADGDGQPGDTDGDGIPNDQDNCPDDYNPGQEDTYPPQANNIGDACDCECDFNCDGDVDADDVEAFLVDFGRFEFNNPCTNGNPCNGDCECDTDVDADDVTKFLEDFGRFQFNNPCPTCVAGDWCVYP